MKQLAILLVMVIFIAACGGNSETNTTSSETPVSETKTDNSNPSYDPERGEGKFTKVEVGEKLDGPMAAVGEKVFSVKCSTLL